MAVGEPRENMFICVASEAVMEGDKKGTSLELRGWAKSIENAIKMYY